MICLPPWRNWGWEMYDLSAGRQQVTVIVSPGPEQGAALFPSGVGEEWGMLPGTQ